MRYKLLVVIGVLRNVYVTPFLYACFDQTSMLGRVWRMCVLSKAILLYAYESDRNSRCRHRFNLFMIA
jgi:hypothetical protein